MAIKKIIVNNVVNMDVSQDTVTENTLLNTYTAHKSDGTQITGTYTPSGGTYQSKTVSITPTESAQTQTVSPDSGYDALSSVTVNTSAISSTYVGSGIDRRDSTDLYGLYDYGEYSVNVPRGYYDQSYYKSVPNGTAGTPIATKGTVSNHSITVTPSVTNTEGYILGGNKTGTAVTVSASELVSGSQTITTNNTYDVTNLAEIVVSVQSQSPNLQSKTNINPTESSQTITPDSGYDGLSSVQINAVSSTYVGSNISRRSSTDLTVSGATVTAPAGYYSASASKSVASGSVTAPASISGTSASVSTGTNTITLSKTVSVTPSVSTAGYVSAGTAGNSAVSLTASVTTKAAATITPGTSNQTIAAGTYLTGAQTIAGDADLVGSNILSTANIFGVQGTVTFQTYYTGSSAPSSSQGVNGDIYLQT